jgi:eukaryotic-like serine/threonine-protein kinase
VADYLAPEQALNSSKPGPRIDIYSLGCTLYFLLVGTPPFGDGSVSETLFKHQTAMPTPIDQLRPELPKELEQICAKMLAKNPADRYQTAGEVAAALSRVE